MGFISGFISGSGAQEGIVDEAGLADPDGEGDEGGAEDGAGQGLEGFVVDDGNVVDPGVGSAGEDGAHGGREKGGVAFAVDEEAFGLIECASEDGGLRALGGGEVLVAGGARKSVGFAAGGAGDDLDGEA